MRKTVQLHLKAALAGYLLGGMSPRWVARMVKQGEMEGYWMGRELIVTADSVNAFLERRRLSPESQQTNPEETYE